MNSDTPARRRALIVGGGMAGLSHAIALHQAGHSAEIVELQPAWRITGWGLSLTGPALRALRSLKLMDACIGAGYGIRQISNCDSEGIVRHVVELPPLLGPGLPAQAGLARSALHHILRDEAAASGATITTGLTVDGIEDGENFVTVTLSDGSTRQVDYVVGADGVNSKTRSLLGFHQEPEYTGQMVWRAIVPRPTWATSLHTFAGATHNAGVIPISEDQAYVFLTENVEEITFLPDHELADRMRALLEPFGGRVTEVRESIQDPAMVVRRPVHVIMLTNGWHRGRSVLIGDAAHTPSPQMVSGAALAIEDGVVLAEEISRAESVEKAFVTFEHRRLDRAQTLVATSVSIGAHEKAGMHTEVNRLQAQGHAQMAGEI